MTLWIHNGSQQLDEISDYRTILGVCIALPILMVVIVGMRAYTRIKLLHSIGLDDWIIFFSTVSSCSRVLSSLRLIISVSSVPSSMLACASDSQHGVLVFLLVYVRRKTSTSIQWYVVYLLARQLITTETKVNHRSISPAAPYICSASSASKLHFAGHTYAS